MILEADIARYATHRCHDLSTAGNHLGLHASQPVPAHRRGLKPGLQRACAAPMRRVTQRDSDAFSEWYMKTLEPGCARLEMGRGLLCGEGRC